jgi:hypothetical protein
MSKAKASEACQNNKPSNSSDDTRAPIKNFDEEIKEL